MALRSWLKKKIKESADKESFKRSVNLALTYKAMAARIPDAAERKSILQRGIKVISKEIERRPNQPILYSSRASLFMSLAEYEKARDDLEKIPLDDERVLREASKGGMDLRKTVRENLVVTEYRLGNYDEAAEHYLKMKIGEDVPQELLQSPELLHYVKGYMFDKDKRPEGARKEYEKVLELSPNLDSESLKRFSEFPKRDRFFFNLALLEYYANNIDGAIKYCERSLEINPSSEDATEILKKLKDIRVL